ncbi:MAG: hypothetical protein M5T61_03855 [Acidimicrobiia bacterium]|nr:hypothetical protein [Acidimicrobiia bacterium]
MTAEARLRLRSDVGTYSIEIDLDTTDGGGPFLARTWSAEVPRDLQ